MIFGSKNSALYVFNPADVYDELGPIFGALNISALLLCLFLVVKGLNFPSTDDNGSTGNIVMDYYWGTGTYTLSI